MGACEQNTISFSRYKQTASPTIYLPKERADGRSGGRDNVDGRKTRHVGQSSSRRNKKVTTKRGEKIDQRFEQEEWEEK